jgi:hypothetical protein
MEKLIELLNEYENVNNWYATYTTRWEDSKRELKSSYMFDEPQNIIQIYIISKSFWFIKRLVENDKIDLEKVEKKFYNEICITDYWDKDRAYWKSDLVISVLSISENPIEDLISYLK